MTVSLSLCMTVSLSLYDCLSLSLSVSLSHAHTRTSPCLTASLHLSRSDDPNGTFPNTKLVLQELDIPHVTSDDCRHVQQVCWQVSQRAAYLAATGENKCAAEH